MHLAEIWRYPVKSMGGERLAAATLGPLGIEGDRVVHVEDARGRVVTARTHPALLGHHAVLGPGEEPLVDGQVWTSQPIASEVQAIAGRGARLVRDDSADRFDVLPLLIASDGAIAAFGFDGRRLRPNLVVGGVVGLEERSWPGDCLKIGGVVIAIESLRGRCVMTTFDPDTLEQNLDVLRRIIDRFEGRLALNASVIQGGPVRQGDPVEIVKRNSENAW